MKKTQGIDYVWVYLLTRLCSLSARTEYQIELENDLDKLALVLRGILNEIKVGSCVHCCGTVKMLKKEL